MALSTRSEFLYGYEVTLTNNSIPFTEGGGEILATVNIGTYSLSDFVIEIARAMNAVGGQIYGTTVNRTTRKISISASSSFNILFGTGSTSSISPAVIMGFDIVDTGLSVSHEGSNASGDSYRPQFFLEKFVDFQNNVQSSQATVNVSASGVTEVVTFGRNQIMECNIKYITDVDQSRCLIIAIEDNPTGLNDFRRFMNFIIGKGNIEFIQDRNLPNSFTKCFLESTKGGKDGTSFKIKELTSQKLANFYESGLLKFRETVTN